MRINRFTKVCFVLLVIVGGLLALNWPFQTPRPTHAIGVIHPVHSPVSSWWGILSGLLSTGGALVFGVILLVVIVALVSVRKGR